MKSKKQMQLYQAVEFFKSKQYLMPNDSKLLLGVISNNPSKLIKKFNEKKVKREREQEEKKLAERDRSGDATRNGLPHVEESKEASLRL